MPDRSETFAAALFVIPAGLVLVLRFTLPALVTSNRPVLFLLFSLPLYVYATYWAFSTRRALAVRTYKGQALASGILSLSFWLTGNVFIVIAGASSDLRLVAGVPVILVCILLMAFFYFTDTTMRAARRSDPLRRDIFWWSGVRLPLWVLSIVGIGAVLVVAVYGTLTDSTGVLNDLNNGGFSNALFNFDFGYFIYVPFIGILWLGAAALRASWDGALRRNVGWLTLSVLLFYASLLINIPGFFAPLFLAVGFTLFMAVHSLAPVNRMQTLPVDA